jgi:hypothetical protein
VSTVAENTRVVAVVATVGLTLLAGGGMLSSMNAVEFTTELNGSNVLEVPSEVAARLPKAGRARVIVLTDGVDEEAGWRLGAYGQFVREDAPEDAIYDSLR